jgi:hypothetical protein
MKNLFVCLILLFALSCSKTVVPEQKIFENLPRCCKAGDILCETAFQTTYTFTDITGILVGYGKKDSVKFDVIYSDTLLKIDIPEEVIRDYIYRRPNVQICNMPNEILYGKKSRKVKFTCIVPRGKPRPSNEAVPQYTQSIEICKPTVRGFSF